MPPLYLHQLVLPRRGTLSAEAGTPGAGLLASAASTLPPPTLELEGRGVCQQE